MPFTVLVVARARLPAPEVHPPVVMRRVFSNPLPILVPNTPGIVVVVRLHQFTLVQGPGATSR